MQDLVARGRIDEDDEDRNGIYEVDDIDYARFLQSEGDNAGNSEKKLLQGRMTGGMRGFTDGMHPGDDVSSASFGK